MTTPNRHHVDTATLMSYSAGTLNQALSAVVACHVSTCSACAREVADMNMLGSSLLSTMPIPLHASTEAVPLPPQTPEKHSEEIASTTPATKTSHFVLPEPLRKVFDFADKPIHWRQLAPGVWHYKFKLSGKEPGDLRLLRISPGNRMLEHGHGGTELTLVLDGAFSDSTGEYLRGDIQEVAEETEHCPAADRVTGCICLIASERPARFRGWIGKIVQVWTGL